jgi:hypothetical protein
MRTASRIDVTLNGPLMSAYPSATPDTCKGILTWTCFARMRYAAAG